MSVEEERKKWVIIEKPDVLFPQGRDILLQGGDRLPQMIFDIRLKALETLAVAVDILERFADSPVEDRFRHHLRLGELFVLEQPPQPPVPEISGPWGTSTPRATP